MPPESNSKDSNDIEMVPWYRSMSTGSEVTDSSGLGREVSSSF